MGRHAVERDTEHLVALPELRDSLPDARHAAGAVSPERSYPPAEPGADPEGGEGIEEVEPGGDDLDLDFPFSGRATDGGNERDPLDGSGRHDFRPECAPRGLDPVNGVRGLLPDLGGRPDKPRHVPPASTDGHLVFAPRVDEGRGESAYLRVAGDVGQVDQGAP